MSLAPKRHVPVSLNFSEKEKSRLRHWTTARPGSREARQCCEYANRSGRSCRSLCAQDWIGEICLEHDVRPRKRKSLTMHGCGSPHGHSAAKMNRRCATLMNSPREMSILSTVSTTKVGADSRNDSMVVRSTPDDCEIRMMRLLVRHKTNGTPTL